MYYDVVKSGERIQQLRDVSGVTREQIAEILEVTPDAMRKIEKGKNGARIDTLILLADYFHVTLDYLICGVLENNGLQEDVLVGLKEQELLFIHNMVAGAVENLKLLRQ